MKALYNASSFCKQSTSVSLANSGKDQFLLTLSQVAVIVNLKRILQLVKEVR